MSVTESQLADLRARLDGEVHSDRVSRGIYATDASHYQIMPSVVVLPRHEADVIAALRWATEHGVCITPRGGGTSLSGQTTWSGMVLDLSKYMNRVLQVRPEESWACVQAGAVRDEINRALESHGLYFGPDPATGNRATIGGMVGNNTSGTRSVIHGRTLENVLACRVALTDGTLVDLAATSRSQWLERESRHDRQSELYRGVRAIIERESDEIRKRFPRVLRRVSGYNLDAFSVTDPRDPGKDSPDWNLAHLIIGSEGTLGVLLEAKLRLVPIPAATAVCVVHYGSVIDAADSVDTLLEHSPSAIELLDGTILRAAATNPSVCRAQTRDDLFADDPAAVLIVEFSGDSLAEVEDRGQSLAASLADQSIGSAWPVATDPADVAFVWSVRKAGLGLLANEPGVRKSQAFIEDAAIPTNRLANYLDDVMRICEAHQVESSYYGHASVGVIHIRPKLDMHNQADVQKMKEIADEVFPRVQHYGGSWSGEHGDGLVRGAFIPKFFGDQIYEAFRQIKGLFDPEGRMNPGKIVDTPSMTDNLRYGDFYRPQTPETAFQFRDQGGWLPAIEKCVGVGLCRKTGSGTMCPSYMATRDEEHSTRGRANALRLAISGQLGPDALTGQRIDDVLSLCLSCKACQSECPTSVDVGRMKSEVLAQRYARFGIPASARLLGRFPRMAARFSGRWSGVLNRLLGLPGLRFLIEKRYQIDRRRPLPKLATVPFDQWWKQHIPATDTTLPGVSLFIDTFTNYVEPQVGQAAVRLLEACGYQVHAIQTGCCQRPQISQGLLKEASRDGQQTLASLENHVANNHRTVLVLEPSCASALIDDLPDLAPESTISKTTLKKIVPVENFLADQIESGRLGHIRWQSTAPRLLVHGHCHQKSHFGMQALHTILDRLENADYEEIDSGCCGMAGAFGYQHHDLSRKIGEDRLFDAIRNCTDATQVIACGISCRHQIADFLNREARHWVEVITAEPITTNSFTTTSSPTMGMP